LATAQAVHAAFQFQQQHPEITRSWLRDSQFLVIVSVPDDIALIGLASRALEAGIDVSTWHEPDMADSATAVALQPGAIARRLCSNLPLHGRTLAEAV
ncbi:MAG: peptidyl-tRNA hydrolase, partial [Ilumatobacteraceae bacterium]